MTVRIAIWGAALSVALAFCGLTSAVAAEAPLSVLHFWISGGEQAAMAVVRGAYEQRGGVLKENSVADAVALRKSLMSRTLAGYPPGAVQWQGNVSLGEMVDMDAIVDIERLAVVGGWRRVLSKRVQALTSHEGHFYLAPIGVHAENWLWSNAALFRAHGLTAPQTWPEFLAVAEAFATQGVVPLAVGRSRWERHLLFNTILTGVLGRDGFRRLVEDNDLSVVSGPAGVEAFRILGEIRKFPGVRDQAGGWSEATADVIAGRAAMQIMGDWAKGEFLRAGKVIGDDFGCQIAPGNQGVYHVVVDAFAFPPPATSEHARAQRLFAETVMDPNVQLAFSQAKGSIPPRLDVDLTLLDDCAQIGARIAADPQSQIAPASLSMNFNLLASVVALINGFFDDPTVTPQDAAQELVARHQKFGRRSPP